MSKKTAVHPKHDWRNLVGFAGQQARVQQLLVEQRLSQVILFTGRSGLGKRQFLRAVSALHVCEHGSACGACGPCALVMAGIHPDILFVESDGKPLKVEDAALIQEHLALFPHHGGVHARRIVAIADAEVLTSQAMNRLLKLLEEPPAKAQIYLTTSRKDLLLPTLLSRCSRWVLPSPSLGELQGLVQRLAQELAVPSPEPATCDYLIRRCAMAPGKIISYLKAANGATFPVEDLCSRLLSSCTSEEVIDTAKLIVDGKLVGSSEIAEVMEYALNRLYLGVVNGDDTRHQNGGSSPQCIATEPMIARRQMLHRIKDLTGKKRIVLNTQLVCEQIGLLSAAD